MADQSDMESQLAIIRSLRAAADVWAQAQAAAAERQRAESAVAQATYDAEKASADAMLSQAEAAHEQARVALKRVRLGRLIKAAYPESEVAAGDDIQGELAAAVATIKPLPDVLLARAAELRGLRLRRAQRRGVIALGFALLVALLAFAVPRLRVEIPYRLGVAALTQERWEWAQGSLRSVVAVNPQYKDAPILLREAYYRPASAALDAGQWEEARAGLRALLQLDPTYRDASTLLQESYWRPIQQAAAADQTMNAAQAIVQWRAYGPNDERVSKLLSESPAVRQAVSELYASLWAQGRIAGQGSYAGNSTAVRSLAVAQDGRLVAASQEDGDIALLDTETGFPLQHFDARGVTALSLDFAR